MRRRPSVSFVWRFMKCKLTQQGSQAPMRGHRLAVNLDLQSGHNNGSISENREYGQHRVHTTFGLYCLYSLFSILEYWAIIFGILEVQERQSPQADGLNRNPTEPAPASTPLWSRSKTLNPLAYIHVLSGDQTQHGAPLARHPRIHGGAQRGGAAHGG